MSCRLVYLLLTFVSFSSCAQIANSSVKNKPYTLLTLDIYPNENQMLGFTLAPYHFDQNYDNWGYYISFARGKTATLDDLGRHHNGESQHYRYRFGLSYSLNANLSVYGGAITDTRELNISTNIAPQMVGANPVTVSSSYQNTQWGGEIGARLALDFGLAVSVGYNSISNGVIGGIGFRF